MLAVFNTHSKEKSQQNYMSKSSYNRVVTLNNAENELLVFSIFYQVGLLTKGYYCKDLAYPFNWAFALISSMTLQKYLCPVNLLL